MLAMSKFDHLCLKNYLFQVYIKWSSVRLLYTINKLEIYIYSYRKNIHGDKQVASDD